jgi:glutaredoxin 3
MKKVEIYTTPTCHYCKMAKEFFKTHGVEYTEHDVLADMKAREEMVQKSGQMGVPVLVIGDEMVVGFDEDKIAGLLGV